ncbi:MAG: 4'-phosphopantetheinyl transferase superfamily protein [Gloeomargarita sp. SKYBB_i_bin120]|nr:4'-phosphopantetheinyl transferase superfamily protein [Gloeomargarita sp. SKYG98]MCS7291426.1 4'-phosphopantetheinyl transferase superfamily protein [Gloeomargarita sp. SKYB120]MDW8176986.1 4'-phosphopantetheinyl transferase superfamily protein [Gloeomargarita sp. SKYBB_i_bin120]
MSLPSTFTRVELLVKEIDVYWVDTGDWPTERIEALMGILPPADRAEMAGLTCARKRHYFCLSRGLLRILLGSYLGVAPANLGFERNRWGKLQLPGRSFHFNLSHSGTRIVFALSRLYTVGVDVEQIRPLRCLDRLVQRYCTLAERRMWQRLSADAQVRFFLQRWVAKEAYAKAWGTGLAGLLRSFRDLDTTAGDRLGLPGGWWTQWQPLELGDPYVGALCWGLTPGASA